MADDREKIDISCPDPVGWLSLAKGKADPDQAASLSHHATECAECAARLKDAIAISDSERADDEEEALLKSLKSSKPDWQHRMAHDLAAQVNVSGNAPPSGPNKPVMIPMPPRSRRPIFFVAIAAMLVAFLSAALWWKINAREKPEQLLARAYTDSRQIEYRLPDAGYRQFSPAKGADTSASRHSAALLEAELELGRVLSKNNDDPTALALMGRAELLSGNYEAAVANLEKALSRHVDDAETLNDMGCALAYRAEVTRKAGDYPPAIEFFQKALAKDPANPRFLFNLALVYRKMWDVDHAIDTYNKLLALEPKGGWAEEARRDLQELEALRKKKEALMRTVDDPARFIAAAEQKKRFDAELYQDVFWKKWLPAVASNPAARQAASLEAHEFKLRFADRSLEQALVEAGDKRREPAFAALALAILQNQQGNTDAGLSSAKAAIRQFAPSAKASALRAQVELAFASRKASMNKECAATTQQIIKEAEAASYRWIAGQAHIEHASSEFSLARAAMARSELVTTERMLEKIGLRNLAMRANNFTVAVDSLDGNYAAVWDSARAGLSTYWQSAATVARAQDYFFSLRTTASGSGLTKCAGVFFQSAIHFVEQSGNRSMEAADRAYYASFLGETGDYTAERRELDRADKLLRDMPPGPTREYVAWDSALQRAESKTATGRSGEAIRDLQVFAPELNLRAANEQMGFHQALGLALVGVAQARRASEEFRKAIELNLKRLAVTPAYLDRLACLQTASESYRELTQIELLENARPEEALGVWLAFKSVGDGRYEPRPSLGTGTLTITFAVLPKGLAIFSEYSGHLTARFIRDTKALESTTQSLVNLCVDSASSQAAIQLAGHALFRELVAPAMRGHPVTEIHVRTDSWLSAIPFAALTDDSGKWLVQSHPILALTGPPTEGEPARYPEHPSALIVSVPVATMPGGAHLAPLTASDEETADLAARFQNAQILRSADARAANIALHAPQTTIFHFTGHGWSNRGNGALLLPPDENGESQFITAKELASQDWSRCSLAVLSACLSATGEQQGAVNNESLVQALLGAGARTVMAARWSIDSEATRALMSEFYKRYIVCRDAELALAGALAEVASLPRWKHPYYWAAFDVFGKDT